MAEHPAVAWLRTALDQAEELARAAAAPDGPTWTHNPDDHWLITGTERIGPVVYDEGVPTNEQAAHIALHDPAAVLRRIAAERQILGVHTDYGSGSCLVCADVTEPRIPEDWPCQVMVLLAKAWGWVDKAGGGV